MDKQPDRAGFDFTLHIRRLCIDIVSRLPELAHVEMDRVAVRYCQVRRSGKHGVQASLTPLRFAGGALETTRGRRRWTIQRLYDSRGAEMLYLLSFYLPRFLEHPFEEKLATICHELWHIAPAFDGDLRRHAGRCYAHGPSERRYHAMMRELAQAFLARQPSPEIYDFLRYSFRELRSRYGAVYGTRIATPKLLPVSPLGV